MAFGGWDGMNESECARLGEARRGGERGGVVGWWVVEKRKFPRGKDGTSHF